ncbi:hypothetical protein DAEQUDRAFT_768977 [Daedalea quercina L-15889]|uniref:Chromo domain-containing protein n=1 Tax=Daedalea quercina L-15889 TaxID=1314783 RepID=A0A165M7D6_9APHY|nr:hypothetical protein DAEQUDRAFT_768977 [Daedalea quercina L-15889]
MQTAQNANGAQQHPPTHHVHSFVQEGVGVAFPQPGMPPGQSGSGGAQNVLAVLALALGGLHDSTADKFAHLEGVVRDMTTSVTEVREAARMDSLKLAEWLDNAHERQMKATMLVLERVRTLEHTIGEVRSLDGDETIVARMQRVDCALSELLEQVQDPQAGFTPPTRHLIDRGTSPIVAAPKHVETGIDAPKIGYADVYVTAAEPLPVLVDVNVSAAERIMTDASTVVAPEVISVGVSTTRIELVDAANGKSTRQYADVGIDALVSEDETACMQTPKGMPRFLHVFGPDKHLHAAFPTSPYNSDPMVPAQWSPERSDSPRSELSYLDPNDIVTQDGSANASSSRMDASIQDVEQNLAPDPSEEALTESALNQGDPFTEDAVALDCGAQQQPQAAPTVPDDNSSTPQANIPPTAPSPAFTSPPPVDHHISPVLSRPPRSTSASSIVQSTSSNTAVNSPAVNATSATTAEPTAPSGLPSKVLLPRKSSQRARSFSPLSSLSPAPSPQITSKRLAARAPILSPSPPPPPRPPLPRRKVRDLPQTQPPASSSNSQTRDAEPVRGHSLVRETSSPDIEIIEKPATFVEKKSKSKSRDADQRKSNKKLERKKAKARQRAIELDSDIEILHPRKRRKTEGDKPAGKGKKSVGSPRRTLGPEASGNQSRKGKQATKHFPDSSPGPQPVTLPTTTKTRKLADDVNCRWPKFIEGDDAYQHEYINCDNCDAWFHYGCVGLAPDDARLAEQESSFFCPPCEVAGRKRKGRHTTENSDAAQCARPDCPSGEENQYFVERIIGRRPSQTVSGSRGMPKFVWLVRWLGWEVTHATWEFPENLGEHSQLIAEFEVAADLEGKDLSDLHVPVLLNEASSAGW